MSIAYAAWHPSKGIHANTVRKLRGDAEFSLYSEPNIGGPDDIAEWKIVPVNVSHQAPQSSREDGR